MASQFHLYYDYDIRNSGSQIHYQSPLSSPSRVKTPASASIKPLHIDTSDADFHPQHEQQSKSTPHFILGSIEEDANGNDCGSPSQGPKPGQNYPNATTISIKSQFKILFSKIGS